VIFQIGEWTVDRDARTLTRDAVERRVSPKAMAVLHRLVEADGAVVSRAALMDAVWPHVTVGEEVLTHAIAELRAAFGREPKVIETVYKSGYRVLARIAEPAPPAKINPRSTDHIEAFAAYLAAETCAEQGGRANCEDAVRHYREAVAADANFAEAHAGLALMLIRQLYYYGGERTVIGEALRHAEFSVALDHALGEARAARGLARSAAGDTAGALQDFRASIRLKPDAVKTYCRLAHVFFTNDAFSAAVAACDRAVLLPAGELRPYLLAAKALRAMGDVEGARKRAQLGLAAAQARLRQAPEDVPALCNVFCGLVDAGDFDAAFNVLSKPREGSDTLAYYLIGGLVRAGETKLALTQLEEVLDHGWSYGAYLARDPDLAPLRREPSFRRMTAALAAT
jgi:DNA-binding winged helix-turn-helix (wHTH) protein